MNQINIALEIYSVVITLLLIGCLVAYKDYKIKLGRLFLAMLVMNFLAVANDIITWVFDGNPNYNILMTTANFFVYFFSYVFVALFTAYITTCIRQRKPFRYANIFLYIVYAACAIAGIMLVVSLFNKMYFYLDAQGKYIRGPQYLFSMIFTICMMFINTIVILAHRKTLGTRDMLALMSYEVLPVFAIIARIFLSDVTFLYSASTVSMLIIYIYIQGEQRRLLYQREQELAESRITLMISQIQPHFIFNTLNSIRELIYSDVDKADQMVVDFSKYLRANITALQGTSISFADELKNVGIYVSIEKERFGDKIKFVKEIECSIFNLPPLIIQPMIENAVKHGIYPKTEGGTIKLATKFDGDYIKIIIEDDGVGFDVTEQKNDAIGINNVKMRIKYLLGTEMRIESEPGRGTRVEIFVPKNYSGEASAIESDLC